MTDRADLIRRLNEAADEEAFYADGCRSIVPRWAEHHDKRAALLREAVKALGGGE